MRATDRYSLLTLPDPEALAEAVAEEAVATLAALDLLGRPTTVALSGGRIAAMFFEKPVRAAGGNRLGFKNVHFFWAAAGSSSPGKNIDARVHGNPGFSWVLSHLILE